MTVTTVPAQIAARARESTRCLLGQAAEDISEQWQTPDNDLKEPLARFDAMRWLLDALGPLDNGAAATVYPEHRAALLEALTDNAGSRAWFAEDERTNGRTDAAARYAAEADDLEAFAAALAGDVGSDHGKAA
jgi:hypothetical protein